MNLVIQSFADAEDFKKERLILKAQTNLDVGAYAVMHSVAASDGNPTSGSKLSFWFPDGEVKAGDLVVLYSKNGERSTKQLKSGATVHFFYWGLDKSIWDQSGTGAVLLRIDEWEWKRLTMK